MKTKLITALRITANALENGTFDYKWNQPTQCNCGSLFCALTGKSAAEIGKVVPKPLNATSADWKTRVGQYCPIAGVPENKLFKELFSYGLTQEDIINLEYLKDGRVLARLTTVRKVVKKTRAHFWSEPVIRTTEVTVPCTLDYKYRRDVAKYMRAWADLLTEEGKDDQAENATPETAEAEA